ncbi:hypothetical protein Naga_103232g1 [Nannochloropsis gaditana]|uniref:Uncharacterized protein n=1 Tax=Nannochloropsis gaditana TaxID=72520 RepID=W7SZJ0_9STRA|nr:hypothetical protein Naga_103232g1 [Nannochloropsis gaditana]
MTFCCKYHLLFMWDVWSSPFMTRSSFIGWEHEEFRIASVTTGGKLTFILKKKAVFGNKWIGPYSSCDTARNSRSPADTSRV